MRNYDVTSNSNSHTLAGTTVWRFIEVKDLAKSVNRRRTPSSQPDAEEQFESIIRQLTTRR
jgi:hypothetical protein